MATVQGYVPLENPSKVPRRSPQSSPVTFQTEVSQETSEFEDAQLHWKEWYRPLPLKAQLVSLQQLQEAREARSAATSPKYRTSATAVNLPVRSSQVAEVGHTKKTVPSKITLTELHNPVELM
ncbi:hypothetical protein Anapl_11875 [Anas platyrhynchos]|uniref:Uncharacterized protein n=1 Tax=Anas platyrhynchos TaxID=8839 RepID=R0M3C7_ANAPL|nr:hypothetical protein Anapl_11875 [Anas platyrhynchos]